MLTLSEVNFEASLGIRAAKHWFATLLLGTGAACPLRWLSLHPWGNPSWGAGARQGWGSVVQPHGHAAVAASLSMGQAEAVASAKAEIFPCCY